MTANGAVGGENGLKIGLKTEKTHILRKGRKGRPPAPKGCGEAGKRNASVGRGRTGGGFSQRHGGTKGKLAAG